MSIALNFPASRSWSSCLNIVHLDTPSIIIRHQRHPQISTLQQAPPRRAPPRRAHRAACSRAVHWNGQIEGHHAKAPVHADKVGEQLRAGVARLGDQALDLGAGGGEPDYTPGYPKGAPISTIRRVTSTSTDDTSRCEQDRRGRKKTGQDERKDCKVA